jgi:hypothetical protein
MKTCSKCGVAKAPEKFPFDGPIVVHIVTCASKSGLLNGQNVIRQKLEWREIWMRLPCDRRSVGLQDASAHGIIDAHADADH